MGRSPTLATLLALAGGAACLAAQAPPPPAWARFTRTFDAYATADSIVGASMLVVGNGHVAAHHEYGFADRAHGVRVDQQTICHWASITKTLTAIAIFQLRDQGLLALDDPVARWVPELRQVHDPYGSIDAITIRMLLGHSAGFQDPTWPYTQGKAWEPFEPTRWDQLVAMMPYQEIHFAPDSRYGYSNPGVIYLARIIEAISGDPWEGYIYKSIWSPLGLTHSYFGTTPAWLRGIRSHNYTLVADSVSDSTHVRDNGADFNPGVTIPNGGWNAPLSDLATYLGFLTGAAPDSSVLRHASLVEMWRSRFPLDSAGTDSIALSFFILHRGGVRFVGHTGSQANFRSFIYIDPRTGNGVVAAFNTSNDAAPERSEMGFRAVRDAALIMLARTPPR